ncbi:MAG: hypothetical protein D9V47_10785 [Clostridia bacterium]|nr:MAG: hypothetical protein D9V47_10785 [Clostridia bacterium]
MSNHRKPMIVILALLLVLALVACGQQQQEAAGPKGESATSKEETAAGGVGEVRGVTGDTIRIGAILDFTGPYKSAGVLMRSGIETYFKYVNDHGGINGRKVVTFFEDNQSNPPTSLAAANKLIFNDKVFALAGVHGSAAFAAIYDLVEKEKVISFSLGHATQDFEPLKKMVFQVPTPYYHQAARIVDFFIDDLGIKEPKIGVIYQDDAMGMDALKGVEAEAKARDIEIVAKEPYQRGATDLSTQVLNLKRSGAEQVIVGGIFTQAGMFLKEAQKVNYKPATAGISPTLNEVVFDVAGEAADGFYAANCFSMPDDETYVQAEEIAKKYNVEPNPHFLYGFVNAAVLTEALEAVGDEITPEKVAAALEKLNKVTVPGFVPSITFGPDKHFATGASGLFKLDYAQKKWVPAAPYKEPVGLQKK